MNSTLKVTSMLDGEEVLYDNKYIYSLYNEGVCVYVGQTKDLRSRVYAHLGDRKEFNMVDYFICCNDVANEMETNEIIKKQPSLNGVLPSTNQYKLLTVLSKEIQEMIANNPDIFNVVYTCGSIEKQKRYITSALSEKIKHSIISIATTDKEIALGED